MFSFASTTPVLASSQTLAGLPVNRAVVLCERLSLVLITADRRCLSRENGPSFNYPVAHARLERDVLGWIILEPNFIFCYVTFSQCQGHSWVKMIQPRRQLIKVTLLCLVNESWGTEEMTGIWARHLTQRHQHSSSVESLKVCVRCSQSPFLGQVKP